MMNLVWLRRVCLALPGATEQIQWGSDLLFKVAGKMFAAACTEPSPTVLSFKCTPEDFAELTERPGVIPAPYLARAQWMALEREDALRPKETEALLRKSYDPVVAKLPKKTREGLDRKDAKPGKKRWFATIHPDPLDRSRGPL